MLPSLSILHEKGLQCKAEELFNHMQSAGVDCDSEAYGMMVRAAANAKDLEGARRWAERMQTAGHSLQAYEYTQLLKACAPRADDVEGSCSTRPLLSSMIRSVLTSFRMSST